MSDAASLLFSILRDDILPIFVVAGVGFVLARHFDVSVQTLSRVTFNALAPCLIFDALVRSTLSSGDFGRMALFCVMNSAAAGLIATAATASLRLERQLRVAFLLVVMVSNSGNFALPLVQFAFGAGALAHATVYFVTSSLLTYTVGVFLAASGRRSMRHALSGVFRVPAIYGVAAALAMRAFEVVPPEAVMRPVGLLTQAALPMMVLVLGMQLERVKHIERPRLVALAAVLSLVIVPGVSFGVARLLGLSGPAFAAAIVQASMPAAVVTTILALEFDVAPNFVTSVVFVTTLASPLTLTAIVAVLSS